jgi:outer membrane protein assembly factor BamA
LFAFRARSIYNQGDRQNQYGFGGINHLRGYSFREFVGSRLAWANFELRFPLIDILSMPVINLFQIRGFAFLDMGAAWFGGRTCGSVSSTCWFDPQTGILRPGFEVWNSELDELQDLRASYGVGFQFRFFGALQLNWVWARRMDFAQFVPSLIGPGEFVKVDGGSTRQEFYIVYDF